MKLEELTDKQLIPLLDESLHAFLPSKDNPDETAKSLVDKFRSDRKYEVLGYNITGKTASYIIALSGRKEDEIAVGPMYVSEDFRGNGLGKQQIADFAQLFGERGYHSIYTKTWLENTASRHCFESLGFSEISRKDSDRVNGDATISYVLHTTKQ